MSYFALWLFNFSFANKNLDNWEKCTTFAAVNIVKLMAIHLVMPDSEANRKLVDYVLLNDEDAYVESDDSLQLPSVDERMKRALDCMNDEGEFAHKYDPIWVMQYINEGGIKEKGLTFYSVQSYRSYLLGIGFENVAGVSTLSQYKSTISGKYPNWTFSDTEDAYERVRRVNVARRFGALYYKGK